MTGRMESVENLDPERTEYEQQREVFHPPRPLEIAARFPHSHSPHDDDTFLQAHEQQNQGDTSTGLTQGTFLLGLDK